MKKDGYVWYRRLCVEPRPDKSTANISFPHGRAELLELGAKVTQVHPEKGRDIAHKYVDYERWRTAEAPYEVQFHIPSGLHSCASSIDYFRFRRERHCP